MRRTRRQRRRRQEMQRWTGLGVLVLGGAAAIAARRPPTETPLPIEGTWTLSALGDTPLDTAKGTDLLGQRVTFEAGKLHGETILRADSAAATVALPFPDETVSRMENDPTGYRVTAHWDGTYRLLENRRVELHVGTAFYVAVVTWDEPHHRLQFDHDPILMVPGSAAYAPVP